MENPGSFIVLGHRFAITLSGILNQQWRRGKTQKYLA
jgi:hypothetical protein